VVVFNGVAKMMKIDGIAVEKQKTPEITPGLYQ
jgi:copper(I)-binding protein